MALLTFTPPVPPSPGTKVTPEFKLKSAQFGDGYTQEAPDGINNARYVATLQWDVLLVSEAASIFDFLFARRKAGEAFLYALSDDSTRQWKCTDLTRTRDTPNSINATFREDFSIVP